MGKAKDENTKEYELSEPDYNLLKITNVTTQYNVAGNKIVTDICYLIATARYGYPDNKNLQFEIDFEANDRKMKITELPEVPAPAK